MDQGKCKNDIDFTKLPDKPSYDEGRKPLFGSARPSIDVLQSVENDP